MIKEVLLPMLLIAFAVTSDFFFELQRPKPRNVVLASQLRLWVQTSIVWWEFAGWGSNSHVAKALIFAWCALCYS